jgi:hypothetical protein
MQDDGGLAVCSWEFAAGCARLFEANFSSVAVPLTGSLPQPFFTFETNRNLQTANREPSNLSDPPW